MPADQAAGLRRRSLARPRCIHCFFESPADTVRLAGALGGRGWHVLLIDAHRRVLAEAPARSLFDWRQQLQQGRLNTLPMAHGEGWLAPGLRADAPELAAVARDYDGLLLDSGFLRIEWAPMPGASNFVVIGVPVEAAGLQRAYALAKTLFHSGVRLDISLVGDVAACRRLQAAAAHFLSPAFAQALGIAADGVDAFVALAVRMTGEETGPGARG